VKKAKCFVMFQTTDVEKSGISGEGGTFVLKYLIPAL
jgi:hypothetical protein